MARKVDNLPKLVQKQILDSELDLGKVRINHPQGYFANEPDIPITPGSDNIIWRRHYFNQIMGRCVNFNSTVSGFTRGTDYGWCDLSISQQTTDPGVAAARINWLRTGGCSDGTFTTCSGFSWSKYFVPHYKTFRSTSSDLTIDSIVSDHGMVSQAAIPSGYTCMFTTEIKKILGGNVRLSVNTPNSLAIFVSGHTKYSSRNHANNVSYVDFSLFPNEFARLNIAYYSPDNNGFFTFAKNLGDQIDEWRTPPVPSGVQAHYSSFARKEYPGSIAKLTYILAYITPPNDQSIKYVDIDYRSDPYPSWRRVTLPVNQGSPNTQISGLFRVPPLTQVYCRARSINEFGDVGQWHTVSGLVSAAGNIKPGLTPDPLPIRSFTVSPGLSQFQFEFKPSQEEEWRDFILISGYKNDHYQQTGVTLAAGRGTRQIQIAPTSPATPFMVASGMLLTLNGGYASDTTGELHLIESVNVTTQTVTVREPFTRDIAALETWKVYQVAKISPENKFSLFIPNDTNTFYFDLCARNYNGGISYLAQDISSWKTGALTITASGALFEDGGNLLGRNLLRNGSFELPKLSSSWIELGWIEENGSSPYWYTVSGYSVANFMYGPAIFSNLEADHGKQAAVMWQIGSSAEAIVRTGVHSGLWQDIYDTSWNKTYTLKGNVLSIGSTGDYKISGLVGMYHEIWEYPNTLNPIRDFQYGTIPGTAKFISSGYSTTMFKTYPYPTDKWNNTFQKTITMPSQGTANYSPLVRLAITRDNGVNQMHGATGGAASAGLWTGINVYLFDSIYFGRLSRESHLFDEYIDMTRFGWEGIRTNSQALTAHGDHLDIDEKFGFLNVRRRDNTTPTNKSAPSSLISATTSGHMDFPRLVHWAPNVPSLVGCPGDFTTSNSGIFSSSTGSSLTIPSGKALFFEISPKRTFVYNTHTEVLAANTYAITNMIPSGGHTYGGILYDPGRHSVFQIRDIYYDIVGGSSGVRESQRPMVAKWGDLTVKNVRLVCATTIGDLTSTANPTMAVGTIYWHTADVKVYECAAPFVASGVNTVGSNNVGFNAKGGLINIGVQEQEGYSSTSVYKG